VKSRPKAPVKIIASTCILGLNAKITADKTNVGRRLVKLRFHVLRQENPLTQKAKSEANRAYAVANKDFIFQQTSNRVFEIYNYNYINKIAAYKGS
jgi:hypothetical protein